jgi:hypothetical protein
MADRLPPDLGDSALDAILTAARPAFPPTPDLVPRIAGRLGRPRTAARWRLRLAFAVATLLLLLAAGVVAAGALGIGPLRIFLSDESLPSVTVPDTPLGMRLSLGERISPEDAAAMAGRPVLVPAETGGPDEAYLSELGILTLLWAPDGELPSIGTSRIGLLLMAIPGDLDPDLVSKVVVESSATLQPVSVAGSDGYWISGAPHVLRYFRPNGADGAVASRLVGEALVWERDGAVYRIESALGRDASVALAESLAPWP